MNERILKQQLRQTEIMTILSEKRTVLSELRTWATMVLFLFTIVTATIAIQKSGSYTGMTFFNYLIFVSIIFILVMLFLIVKNIKELFFLNRKVQKMALP